MKKLLILAAILNLCVLSSCGSKCDCPESTCPVAAQTEPAESTPAVNTNTPEGHTPIPAGDPEIALPAPADVSVTLTQSLKNRRSIRAYTDESISLEQLSALLWSANGVNRDDKKRTAPSAMNRVSVSIYAAFEKGAYKYDAEGRRLVLVSGEDLRPVKLAPVELILTSFYENEVIRGIDVGTVAQNVALYAAAEDLATVIRMQKGPQEALQAALKLEANDHPVCNMAIGFKEE